MEGYQGLVGLLLNRGADVNAQGGSHGYALQAASNRGHHEIVELLLNKGANIHVQKGAYGNGLHSASEGGLEEIVKLSKEYALLHRLRSSPAIGL
jgi:ankyrin repeat protein